MASLQKVLDGPEPTNLAIYFSGVFIRPLLFSVPMGGVTDTVLKSGRFFATPVQTCGVSATPVQPGGVSALTRNISVIGLSKKKSTFSLSVLQKIMIYML